MEHTNKIAIQILYDEYADYRKNTWHYDDQYNMIVNGIKESIKIRNEATGDVYSLIELKNRIKELEEAIKNPQVDIDTDGDIVITIKTDYYVVDVVDKSVTYANLLDGAKSVREI